MFVNFHAIRYGDTLYVHVFLVDSTHISVERDAICPNHNCISVTNDIAYRFLYLQTYIEPISLVVPRVTAGLNSNPVEFWKLQHWHGDPKMYCTVNKYCGYEVLQIGSR